MRPGVPTLLKRRLKKLEGKNGDRGSIQIWMFKALALVSKKVLIFRLWLSALKFNWICQRYF
jgi:hypothetical protein